jgi:hypothetical protein
LLIIDFGTWLDFSFAELHPLNTTKAVAQTTMKAAKRARICFTLIFPHSLTTEPFLISDLAEGTDRLYDIPLGGSSS